MAQTCQTSISNLPISKSNNKQVISVRPESLTRSRHVVFSTDTATSHVAGMQSICCTLTYQSHTQRSFAKRCLRRSRPGSARLHLTAPYEHLRRHRLPPSAIHAGPCMPHVGKTYHSWTMSRSWHYPAQNRFSSTLPDIHIC